MDGFSFQNMERVREPPELILDENDDHLIFEIPTDPNDNQTRQQQRNRDSREKSEANTSISPTKGGKIPHKVFPTLSFLYQTNHSFLLSGYSWTRNAESSNR